MGCCFLLITLELTSLIVKMKLVQFLLQLDPFHQLRLQPRKAPFLTYLPIGVCTTEISEKDIKDKSQLQQKALERFNQAHILIKQEDGSFRFKIKVSRLPDDLYPENVDGVKITNQALSRYYALENRLYSQRNGVLKKRVHDRVQALIDEGIIKEIGKYEDHKEDFLKTQTKDEESILLPWQCVIDNTKTMEHSRIRL